MNQYRTSLPSVLLLYVYMILVAYSGRFLWMRDLRARAFHVARHALRAARHVLRARVGLLPRVRTTLCARAFWRVVVERARARGTPRFAPSSSIFLLRLHVSFWLLCSLCLSSIYSGLYPSPYYTILYDTIYQPPSARFCACALALFAAIRTCARTRCMLHFAAVALHA